LLNITSQWITGLLLEAGRAETEGCQLNDPSEESKHLREITSVKQAQAQARTQLSANEQQISGGFCSLEGAQIFCRICGYLSILRKQGYQRLDALEQAFLGHPISPDLQPK